MVLCLYGMGSVDDNSAFLMLEGPCDQAVDWLMIKLHQAGLWVVRTFDLQSTRQAQGACPCPHHGTDICDCQMMVLLVYQAHQGPVSIIAHGYNRRTWFSIVNTPQQRPDPHLDAMIRSLVETPLFRPIHLENESHAT